MKRARRGLFRVLCTNSYFSSPDASPDRGSGRGLSSNSVASAHSALDHSASAFMFS